MVLGRAVSLLRVTVLGISGLAGFVAFGAIAANLHGSSVLQIGVAALMGYVSVVGTRRVLAISEIPKLLSISGTTRW